MRPTVEPNHLSFAPAATPTFIANLIEKAVNAFEEDRTASRDYLLRAVELLRGQVRQARVSGAAPVRGRLATWQVKRVMAYIDANLSSIMHSKDLANLVNLSASHFCRAFKVSVGIPPWEYITRRRVDRAREMMSDTDEPLSQVALSCGLSDQSSFCRVFRRVTGQSPSEWRRMHATAAWVHGSTRRALS
jgi:AraC family transcriptional regulator